MVRERASKEVSVKREGFSNNQETRVQREALVPDSDSGYGFRAMCTSGRESPLGKIKVACSMYFVI